MIVAHLPAGYLASRALQQRSGHRAHLWAGLLGSIFPDFDLLYFYLVDGQQTLHHRYWTHLPVFWLGVALAAFMVLRGPLRQLRMPALMFVTGVFTHLALDTMAGSIQWLYPYAETGFTLITVPARFDWWVTNFILHWSFAFEVAIIFAAASVWAKSRKGSAAKRIGAHRPAQHPLSLPG